MAEKKGKGEMIVCPVGKFFMDLEKTLGKRSEFFEHMSRSRIEFLKGIRSLLDERIDFLEKKRSGKVDKRMTKIKVE